MRDQRLSWIGVGLAVVALVGILYLLIQERVADRMILYSFVALLALGIGLTGAARPTMRGRLGASLAGGVIAWLAATLGAAVLTLVKQGHFDKGGPLGIAFILAVYIGVPTLVFGAFFATVLPMMLRRR